MDIQDKVDQQHAPESVGPADFARRWSHPYISDTSGMWTVMTEKALSPNQVRFGLKSVLSAQTLKRLLALSIAQDQLFSKYLATHPECTKEG